MRIAYVVHKFPPESLGGTELHTWSLACAMAALGHTVHVFYPLAGIPPSQRQIERDGLHLWRAPFAATRERESAPRQFWHTFRDGAIEADFQRFLRAVRPDIVHFMHVQGVSARLIALARGIPRVLTLHDYWYFCANSQLVRPDRKPCVHPRLGWDCVDCATVRADLTELRSLRPLVALPFWQRYRYLRRLVSEVELLTTPSRFLRDRYAEHGFPAERFVVLENGLDPNRLTVRPETPIAPPPVRPHICFLGSLAWQKGVHVLIEAFNRLDIPASLTVYGSERGFPDYVAALHAQARHPHIRFAGALAPEWVGSALSQCDLLVVPSLWYENSPLVIQEAYALGVPVVASRLGAIEEKVEEGVTGRLFTPGDADDLRRVLKELLSQPDALQRLRANLRPAWTIQEQAVELASRYAGLVAGRRV